MERSQHRIGGARCAVLLGRVSFALQLQKVAQKRYRSAMTDLLDRAIAAARSLPPDAQDHIARLVLELASDEDQAVIQLTPEEAASFDESFAQAARGEFATDEQIRAIWAKHGL
jgi:hypothetical protein